METVVNTAAAVGNTAKNLIWGEEKEGEDRVEKQQEEPVSGKMGDTESGEPYDAGNIESSLKESTAMEDATKSTIASTKIDPLAPLAPTTSGSCCCTHKTETTIADTNIDSLASTSTGLPDRTKTDNLTAKPEEVAHPSLVAGGASTVAGGVEQPLPEGHKSYPIQSSSFPETSSETTPLDADQGAAAPRQAPTSDEFSKIEEIKPKVDGSEPSYLEKNAPGVQPNSAGEIIGAEGELQKESVGEGTGENYVESSGMKADGGDFNASAPGAGKEADRLLETKGTPHNNADSAAADYGDTDFGDADSGDTPDGIGGDGKQKKSLKEKLKDGKEKVMEKLHKH